MDVLNHPDLFRQVPYMSAEEQIERKAERMINRVDREFLSGRVKMSSWEYEERLRNIDEWSRIQLKRLELVEKNRKK